MENQDLELLNFSSAAALDAFVQGAAGPAGAEFLQSWTGGEILRAAGSETARIGLRRRSDSRVMAAATIVKVSLGAGFSYFFSPRGPILKGKSAAADKDSLEILSEEIRKRDPRALFWRIEPLRLPAGLSIAAQKSVDLNPRQTLILDLAKSEEELLAAMSPKTRYNIRLAEKKGIRVREGGLEDFAAFWRLMELTGDRDGFRLHGADHYKNLLTAGVGAVKLFLAEYEGRPVAAGLFSFWGDKATYLHGASDNEFRQLMAPHLLQWTAITAARRDAFKYYDFHGIDEAKWPGVTRFKLGFGGRRAEYAGTWDLVFRPAAYRIYKFMRQLRRRMG